jgi:pimeloyl-ACP methyl ester carboxylesterase
VVTNGTLYMDLVQLSAGQQLLEALPDARLDAGALTRDNVVGGLIATFSPDHRVDDTELAAAWELISAGEGERLLARHARYIDERRRNETRFTPPVVDHPSPLTVVWGIDDPIAVPAMADRLAGARPDARVVRLAGVGHYPMVEVPARFVAAVLGRD